MVGLLITGGTGSLGRALLQAALAGTAYDRVCVLSRDDYKQHLLAEQIGPDPRLRLFLGDVRDPERVARACHGIAAVIHTAALKWVADGVYSADEILKTNFQGTVNVILAALAAGVPKVLIVSSDKACHPTTVYGASKLAAEHYAVGSNSFAAPRGTHVGVVRFGNLIWSRGSVYHRFRAQQAAGKPFRMTDPAMTRFGIPRSAAAGFLLAALESLQGGDILVPKMRAWDLRVLGEAIASGHPAEVVGLRGGGEKRHEMLVTPEERDRTLDQRTHFVIEPSRPTWARTAARGVPLPESGAGTSADVTRFSVADLRNLWDDVDNWLEGERCTRS